MVRLAMVSIEESGSAEAIWPGRRGGWRHAGPEHYEVIDVSERTQTLDGWHRPDDSPEAMGPVHYKDAEVSPPGALADEEPDEEHFHEATGNAGASFDRTCRRAALVLWPQTRELQVIQQGGPEAAIAALERFLDSADAPRADAMAHLIVDEWPRPSPEFSWTPYRHDRPRLIAALARVNDAAPLRRFLLEVIGAGAFDGSETEAIVAALGRLPESDATAIVAAIARGRATARFAPVARQLRAAASARPGAYLRPAVQAVLAAMPTVGETSSSEGGGKANRGEGLADLIHAIGRMAAPDLGAELARVALANPVPWPFDGVIIPAVLALPRSGNPAHLAATDALREASLVHLRARTALPLAPPGDAARSTDGLTCNCANCSALRSFLADPVATTWALKAAALQRAHVEESIRRAGCDVDFRTERRGSPHTLVCTKNQALRPFDERCAEPTAAGTGRRVGSGPRAPRPAPFHTRRLP